MTHKRQPKPTQRRSVLKALMSLPSIAFFARPASAAFLTPSATEGPFYPKPSMRFADNDNDLVRIAGLVRDSGGEIITLQGVVQSADGQPVRDARVEIWQCDVNGKYLHSGDNREVSYDQAFQGFGHYVTGPDGAYWFRTIKPTIYPGRTPHIHVKTFVGDQELTTQFYIKGHPQNPSDGIYRRLSEPERKSVEMIFVETTDGTIATVNITV